MIMEKFMWGQTGPLFAIYDLGEG